MQANIGHVNDDDDDRVDMILIEHRAQWILIEHRAQCRGKQPPTRKPKVPRVISGYGGLMIPLSQDRPSRKNGGFIGVTGH